MPFLVAHVPGIALSFMRGAAEHMEPTERGVVGVQYGSRPVRDSVPTDKRWGPSTAPDMRQPFGLAQWQPPAPPPSRRSPAGTGVASFAALAAAAGPVGIPAPPLASTRSQTGGHPGPGVPLTGRRATTDDAGSGGRGGDGVIAETAQEEDGGPAVSATPLYKVCCCCYCCCTPTCRRQPFTPPTWLPPQCTQTVAVVDATGGGGGRSDLVSVFDGRTRYVVGATTRAAPGAGGLYAYASVREALGGRFPRQSALVDAPRALLRVECQRGSRVRADGSAWYCTELFVAEVVRYLPPPPAAAAGRVVASRPSGTDKPKWY